MPPPLSVNQFTLEDKFIKTFSSATEAALELGIHQQHISKTCNNKRSKAGGFIWKFADDPDLPNEDWKTEVIDGIDVSTSSLGRVKVGGQMKTFGTTWGETEGQHQRKMITIGGVTKNVGEVILTMWSESRPLGMYLIHKNRDSIDNRPETLFWDKNNNVNRMNNNKQTGEAKSMPVQIIKSDKDENVIIEYEYSSLKEASLKSLNDVGKHIFESSISKVCNGIQQTTGGQKKIKYRFKPDKNKWILGEKTRLKMDFINSLDNTHDNLFGDKSLVSNYGNIQDEFGRILTKTDFGKDCNGYLKFHGMKIHKLVGFAFVHNPNPKIYKTIDHIDGDKTNNHESNLRWADTKMQANNRSNNIIQKKSD